MMTEKNSSDQTSDTALENYYQRQKQIAELMTRFKTSDFYPVIRDKFTQTIAELDDAQQYERDIHRRYAITEAYAVLTRLWLWFEDFPRQFQEQVEGRELFRHELEGEAQGINDPEQEILV